MVNRLATGLSLGAMLAVAGVACTVNPTDIPDLTGPSVFARSFSITANPDSITHDGASQSTITVTARDANGAAVAGQPIRLDIFVDGAEASYGTLSARTIVTASDGRATAFYTAPPAPPTGASTGACSPSGGFGPFLPGPCVTIAATLLGTSGFTQGTFGTNSQVVDIHLIPIVVIPLPGSPTADFVFFPSMPTKGQQIIFNASTSFAAPGRTIVSYVWNWGDGETGNGMVEDHDYPIPGTYSVTLTVTDDAGNQGAIAKIIKVS